MKAYKIVFTSKTGNTEKIAKAIYEILPDRSKDIERLTEDTKTNDADMYLIGFWVDRGSCSIDIMDFLDELDGKKVFLFGTCGMKPDREYYKRIENNVKAFIPDGNDYLGLYLCQGKMPMSIRSRYEDMKEKPEYQDEAERMLRNFDDGLLHPDAKDLEEAKRSVKIIIEKEEYQYE